MPTRDELAVKRRTTPNGAKKRRRLTKSEILAMQRLRRLINPDTQKQYSYRDIAERFKVNVHTVYAHCRDAAAGSTKGPVALAAEADSIPPKLWDRLKEDDRLCLEDGQFWRFRLRFFDRETPAFQQDLAEQMSAGQDLLVLLPPGHGKSTLVTHDYLIWEMVRHRARGKWWACLLVSAASAMAKGFIGQIRRTLERNQGLIDAYGGFRPEEDDTWKADALRVWWPPDDNPGRAERKEPTFIAAGRGTQIYGWRVRQIVVDDLIGKKESLSPEATEGIAEWLHEIVESRLNRGAHVSYVGTRFSPHEVYAHLLSATDRRGRPLYRHLVYKAHDIAKCPGLDCDCEGPCEHHPAWPEGCTLWPAEWPYSALMNMKDKLDKIRPGRFDFVYNQEETVTEEVLIPLSDMAAAQDVGRGLWMFPKGARLICTLDPSAENWCVFQAWAYVPEHETLINQRSHFLVAMERGKMPGPKVVAVMRDWTLRLRALGANPTWVVEVNGFQRWLLQFAEFRQMRADLGGLRVIPHSTHVNKLDPDFGVYSLQTPFAGGKVSIPWHGSAERAALAPFVSEMTSYPHSRTTDCVMAAWFYIHHVRKLVPTAREPAPFLDLPVPAYLKDRQRRIAVYN